MPYFAVGNVWQSALRITVLQNFKCPTHPSFNFGDSMHCLLLKQQCWKWQWKYVNSWPCWM